jgi:hypothetical protein
MDDRLPAGWRLNRNYRYVSKLVTSHKIRFDDLCSAEGQPAEEIADGRGEAIFGPTDVLGHTNNAYAGFVLEKAPEGAFIHRIK